MKPFIAHLDRHRQALLLRAWLHSLFGEDVLEMVLRADLSPAAAQQQQQRQQAAGGGGVSEQGQQQAAASERGVLVTYRSQAGSLKVRGVSQHFSSSGGAAGPTC